MNRYDLAIIGSGPCGYVAGIRAAQLGMKVCVFEKDRVGGVCLNWGCIPTKALIASSSLVDNINNSSIFGINIRDYNVDFNKIYDRKDNIVKRLSSGIEMLLKSKKIELIKEKVTIKGPNTLETNSATIEASNMLIATGSIPFELPNAPFDRGSILSSRDILKLDKLPKSLIIIGGGVIGCEFASIFKSFGVEITMIEMMDRILPTEDKEISRKLEQVFKKRGIKIFTSAKLEKVEKAVSSIKAILSNGESLEAEKALICIGRSPNSRSLGLEEVGVEQNKGWIKVDKDFRTNIKNIYAAGDVIGGVLLAHVASREGIVSVERMNGKDSAIDYDVVPSCIFTSPEIASVGLTEEKAKEKGLDVRSRKFLFSSLGKAHVMGETEGFIKIVVDNKDKIVGSQIMGPHATELIAEFSPCIQFGITSEKLASVIHAHPTLSEAVQEVSESVHGKSIHSL
ncbi:MAG: dihydrolipoyl dehydrogenase [Candidatus Omnitrophota bacterium]